MNLRHIRSFVTLAECLHFGRAAERLSITQPPLSRQIKEMEEHLGVSLFKRNKRNVALTTQGQYMYVEAQKILLQLHNIKHSVQLIDRGIVGQIHIGYVGAAMHCILPELLGRLHRTYPEINTVMEELSPKSQATAIRSGELDVGFVRTPLDIDSLSVKTVFQERYALVVPNSVKLKDTQKQTLRALSDEPFIAFSHECSPAMSASIINICNQCNFSPRIFHQASQLNTIVRMVESGLGYSIVPLSVKHGYKLSVRFVELDEFDERAYLSIIYPKGDLKPIVRNFINLIKK